MCWGAAYVKGDDMWSHTSIKELVGLSMGGGEIQ